MTVLMRTLCALLPIALVPAAFTAHAQAALSKRKYKDGQSIAIIGAGVSGLGLARELMKGGVKADRITVIEANPEVGGKVDSVQVDGKPYELGAMMIVPQRYQVIQDLAAKYELDTRPVAIKGMNLDVTTGELGDQPGFLSQALALIEFGLYKVQYALYFSHLNDPKGFSEIPGVLKKSWPEFVQAQGYTHLDQSFASILSASGFLRPDDPPQAAQIARMLSPDSLQELMTQGIRIFNGQGYQELWKLEADDLKKSGVTFKMNSPVTKISRMDQNTLVSIKGNAAPLDFDHVFYTADLTNLPRLLDQPSAKEVSLFGQVEHYDYRSYIVHIKGLPNADKSAVINFVPTMYTVEAGRPILAIKPYDNTDVYVVYAYGTPNLTDDQIKENIRADISQFPGAQVGKFEAAKTWAYFPHVSMRYDLEKFFRATMDEEGRGGLWFTGEALSYTATIEVYEQAQGMAKLFLQNDL